jgi:hypothetical protein
MDWGVRRHGREREREKGRGRGALGTGKGGGGAIAAEGGEVTAEEKGGSECERERDRFTQESYFSAFAALTRYPLLIARRPEL